MKTVEHCRWFFYFEIYVFFSVTENCRWRLYNIEDYFFTLKFMFFLSERIRIESYKGTLVEQLSGWIAHFANKALKFVSSISRMYRFDFEAVPKAALHDNFIMTWKVGYGHLSFFIFQNMSCLIPLERTREANILVRKYHDLKTFHFHNKSNDIYKICSGMPNNLRLMKNFSKTCVWYRWKYLENLSNF